MQTSIKQYAIVAIFFSCSFLFSTASGMAALNKITKPATVESFSTFDQCKQAWCVYIANKPTETSEVQLCLNKLETDKSIVDLATDTCNRCGGPDDYSSCVATFQERVDRTDDAHLIADDSAAA